MIQSTSISLTSGNWYTAKVVVFEYSPGVERAKIWVDTDQDGDFSDESLNTTVPNVNGYWDAGSVGLYKHSATNATHSFDDVKLGFDADSDDTLDAGEVVLHDDFDTATLTLTHDDNGNLTHDGVYDYVYDFLNRLVQRLFDFMLTAESPQRVIGDKAYDSNKLDEELADAGIEMIAPHRSNRKPENVTQDGRKLRRRKRRWTVERTIGWIQDFRRLCIRWEMSTTLSQGFLHLGYSLVLLREVLG